MRTLSARQGQYPLVAEFVVSYKNWVVDTVDGVKKTLGSSVANSVDPGEPKLLAGTGNITFNAVNLPAGATIMGGDLIVETPFAGSTTPTIKFGSAINSTALLAATSLTAPSRTPLSLTQALAFFAGTPVVAVLATTGVATAGKLRLRVEYTVENRSNEIQPV